MLSTFLHMNHEASDQNALESMAATKKTRRANMNVYLFIHDKLGKLEDARTMIRTTRSRWKTSVRM